MSTPIHTSASPEPLTEPPTATRRISPPGGRNRRLAVITAHGELDAANAQEFVDYALRHAPQMIAWCST